MPKWLLAKLEFASFYSYRMPGLSSQYAPASPVPSPAALKLSLVDAAIQQSGNPDYGQHVFDLIKESPVWTIPPEHVCVLKFFVKRMKKPKAAGAELVESTAIREYCHLSGPLEVYLETSQPEKIAPLFIQLRRLGTTDSLLSSKVEESKEPVYELCWKSLGEPDIPINRNNYKGRLVVSLTDLKPEATFSEVNPYSEMRQRKPFIQDSYILPLVQEKRGGNWSLYRRQPFELTK
jgi:hypothetical protein